MTLADDFRNRARQADADLHGVIDANHGDGTDPEGSYYNGRREVWEEAARLVEADPNFTLCENLKALATGWEIPEETDQYASGSLVVPGPRVAIPPFTRAAAARAIRRLLEGR